MAKNLRTIQVAENDWMMIVAADHVFEGSDCKKWQRLRAQNLTVMAEFFLEQDPKIWRALKSRTRLYRCVFNQLFSVETEHQLIHICQRLNQRHNEELWRLLQLANEQPVTPEKLIAFLVQRYHDKVFQNDQQQ